MPPNVVLIHTHDTGRYIEPYGYRVPTPRLQTLAEDGVLFREAYCAGPTCSPSRGALMSGMAPHSNGVMGLAHSQFKFRMDDYDRHLAGYLSRNGIETALCGTSHEGGSPDECGYDVLPAERYPVGGDGDRARARAVGSYLRDDHESPFFVSFGMSNTHKSFPADYELEGELVPFRGDHDVDPDYVRPPEPLPDVPPVRSEWAGFIESAGIADDCVGIVMDALRESGRIEDTLVLFTTDHGPPFVDMKCFLYDPGINVSLIARFPDGLARGEVVDELVSHIDLYPTLCEYLGIDVPPWVQGKSVLPVLQGEEATVREELFSEVTYHAAYDPKRCVRTDRYKYIRRYDEEHTGYVPVNVDWGPHKAFLLENGLLDRTLPREALYDLYHDPNERDNLVDDPAYEAVYDDLSTRLDEWMERTGDPLREGPVPTPKGGRVYTRDTLDTQGADESDYEAPDVR